MSSHQVHQALQEDEEHQVIMQIMQGNHIYPIHKTHLLHISRHYTSFLCCTTHEYKKTIFHASVNIIPHVCIGTLFVMQEKPLFHAGISIFSHQNCLNAENNSHQQTNSQQKFLVHLGCKMCCTWRAVVSWMAVWSPGTLFSFYSTWLEPDSN